MGVNSRGCRMCSMFLSKWNSFNRTYCLSSLCYYPFVVYLAYFNKRFFRHAFIQHILLLYQLTVVCSTELTQKQTEKNEIYPNKAKLYWSQSIAILSTRSFWRFPLIMVNLIVELDAFISTSSSTKKNHFHFYPFVELDEYSVCRAFASSLCIMM